MIEYRTGVRVGIFAASALLLIARSAGADEGLRAGLLACRAIRDSAARLACFDRAAAALVQEATAPSAEAAAPVAPPSVGAQGAAPPPPLDPKSTFGLPERVVADKEVAAGMRARELRDVTSRLVGLSREGDGRIVFRLDNGQDWRQLLPEGDLLARLGDAVTISRGWLGSYWLKVPSGRNCKVDRVH